MKQSDSVTVMTIIQICLGISDLVWKSLNFTQTSALITVLLMYVVFKHRW